MIQTYLVAAAILSLLPHTSPRRVEYASVAIAEVAGDDIDTAAALVVTGSRESQWRRDVEVCRVNGPGGRGMFQVGHWWGPLQTRCGPVLNQTRLAWHVLDKMRGPNRNHHEMFRAYLGRSKRDPEVKLRALLFERVRGDLACACSENSR
jgi:hypothetical protein